MGLLDSISNGLKAVAAVFGWAQQRDAEKNSPEMIANAHAKLDAEAAKLVAEANAKAAQGDLDAARKLASE